MCYIWSICLQNTRLQNVLSCQRWGLMKTMQQTSLCLKGKNTINQYFKYFTEKFWRKTFKHYLVTCHLSSFNQTCNIQRAGFFNRSAKGKKATSWQLILQSTSVNWDPNRALLHDSIAWLTSKPVSMYQAIKPRISWRLTGYFKTPYPHWNLPLVKFIFRSMFAVVLPSVRDCRGRGEWRLGWLRLAMTSSRCARAPAAPLRSRTGTASRPPWRKTLENFNTRTLPTAHLHRQTAFWTKRKKEPWFFSPFCVSTATRGI